MSKDISTVAEDKEGKWRHQLPAKQRWRRENTGEYLRRAARDRARLMGQEFTLEEGDVIVPDECPILGVPFEYGTMEGASIDRIDNNFGYTPENIWVISRRANVMKSDASPEQLRRFAQWVLNQ